MSRHIERSLLPRLCFGIASCASRYGTWIKQPSPRQGPERREPTSQSIYTPLWRAPHPRAWWRSTNNLTVPEKASPQRGFGFPIRRLRLENRSRDSQFWGLKTYHNRFGVETRWVAMAAQTANQAALAGM